MIFGIWNKKQQDYLDRNHNDDKAAQREARAQAKRDKAAAKKERKDKR